MADKIHRQFADIATYSDTERTAVSIRDGVLEYLGAEIDLELPDKIYTVYRSPATIANAAYAMAGIPLTGEHVSLDGPAPSDGGRVESSTVIDQIDEPTHSRLAVQNKLAVSDSLQTKLKDKRQLSLGYEADLVPHSKWDYEQVNIVPHHLAAVSDGRCGPLCSFLDRKPKEKNMPKKGKAFFDAEGQVNLEQIVEIATALPEAIKKVPVDQLKKIMPSLQQIMMYAKEQGAVEEAPAEGEEDMTDEEAAAKKEAPAAEEDKPKENFADSKAFKDAVASAVKGEVKRYAQVVTKARNFLDADYDFSDKSANQVMADSLATQSTDKFEDSELPVAFKLLRKPNTDYSQFGDTKPDTGLESRITADLGEK
jgi:hypothetical protein